MVVGCSFRAGGDTNIVRKVVGRDTKLAVSIDFAFHALI